MRVERTAFFDDGGCGCTGQPSFGVTYSIHYDDATLSWPEEETRLYLRDVGDWVELETAVLDTDANTLTVVFQIIFPNLYFGVGTPADAGVPLVARAATPNNTTTAAAMVMKKSLPPDICRLPQRTAGLCSA